MDASLLCPECGDKAARVGRIVTWYEMYSYQVIDDDFGYVEIELLEERDSDCQGASDLAYFHCPSYHRWIVPNNVRID